MLSATVLADRTRAEEFALSTNRYYEKHAREYFERTVGADLSHLYDRFLAHVPVGGRILDVGCGSGRDLRAFLERGYRPMGIDPSRALVELARNYSGVPCVVGRIENLAYDHCFEGIWACASLLHLPKGMLRSGLERLRRALVTDCTAFLSVQAGEGEGIAPDGRFYAYYEPKEFLREVQTGGFIVAEAWETEDALPGRDTIRWINVLANPAKAQ